MKARSQRPVAVGLQAIGPPRPGPASRPRPRRRCSGEEGFAGGFAGLLFGFLLFLVGTLFVAAVWAVVDTKAAAVEAARQAARTYVESSSATSASVSALQAADAALAGYGRDPSLATVKLVSGSFRRCQRITIEVSYPAPLVVLPVIGRVGSGERVRADHSELVDPYRSGIPGSAACGAS
ncbi:MAG: hypothetical protein ACRDWW_06490 [Acidimicrobiales bacterium]